MIHIGTAGFSYSDWRGHFYPSGLKPREMLEFYARHFPVIELNSSWHAMPEASNLLSMARRTPAKFRFVVKAFQELTHSRTGGEEVFREFRGALRPLADHGKLACVLAQFPWGFKESGTNRDYLKRLREMMGDEAVVVEFRNESWIKDETLDLLRELAFGFCCVDEPRLRGLVRRHVFLTSTIGYVRFHGRNYETWWDSGRKPWERYDYLYSEAELAEWVPGITRLAAEASEVYLIFNNHYQSKAARNAMMMRELLPPEIVVDAAPEGTLF
ncbi:MAG: DUF72 domain-containing protein [Candidatus Geothermincolia bacterium]